MGLADASVLLWTAGIRNRVLRQVRRLQQPRYLVATIIGGFYFWSVFLRRIRRSSGMPVELDSRALSLIEACAMGVALLIVGGVWLFGMDRAQLAFTEAEIQFLFPAPLSRRSLLAFKLSRSLLRTGLSAVLSTVFMGRFLSDHRGFFAVGAWLSLSTLGMHLTGASLTRESLAHHGRFGLARRWLTLGVVLGAVALLGVWAARGLPPPPASALDLDAVAAWINSITHAPPLSWVLFPVRAPLRVALAQSLPEFLAALPAAVGVLAVHCAWVVFSDVAFEEAAVEAAEARARRMERRRSGRLAISTSGRRFRLPLAPRGRPEVAVLWKNLISARRTAGPLVLTMTLIVGAAAVFGGYQLAQGESGGLGALLGLACAMMAAFLTVLGPTMLRVDLRHDLPHLDILRALPLTGVQVVRAEILSPGLVLAAAQWILLGFAVLLSARYPIEGFPVGERAAAAVAAALVAPAFSLAGLSVQNAAVLLFPGWVVVDRTQPRGIEAIGQRLLATAGTLVVLGVGVVPAALAGGLVWLVLHLLFGLGLYALPLVGAVAAAVVGVELVLATRWMGHLYARFDVTE